VPIRFHVDESVAGAIAAGLRRRGIDVTTPADVGLRGAADSDHLDFAYREHRVILSHDSDFLRLHTAGRPHAGIVFCRQRSRSIGQIVNSLSLLWRTTTPEKLAGAVIFI
jgi:predicted nuclease of predicted toxin-antitoxin system